MKHKLYITFLMTASFLIASSSFGFKAYAERVVRIDVDGLTTISEQVVRDVIPIKAGDEFSFLTLEDAMSYLRKWGVFDIIEVSPSLTREGVVLRFYLEQAIVVESVDIDGNYPYIENKIRKYLSLHAGDIYTPDRVDEQMDRIKAFYKRNGFVGTEVHVEQEMIEETNGIALTFHIRKGGLLRYRNIDVVGNKAYPVGRFVSEINPLRAYSERRLRDAIRDLRDFYHEHGYPKARIRIKEKRIDFENKTVDLVIKIHEGPHVMIRFVGSPHTSRRLLKKTITIISEGSIDEFEIEMSEIELRKLFRKKGYPDAKIEGSKKLLDDGTIEITFTIKEGMPKQIRMLHFTGDEDVKGSDLKKNLQNKKRSYRNSGAYYPDYEDADNEDIVKKMSEHGYLDATVDRWIINPTEDGYALNVTVPITAGRQTLVGGIVFMGNKVFDDKDLLKQIKAKVDKPFNEPQLDDDRKRIEKFYANGGYPYVNIKESWDIDSTSGDAVITYNIFEGEHVTIGRILIVGDVLTSQNAIKSAMNIKEGDSFSYRKIIESQLNIRRLGPFSFVTIEAIGLEDRMSVVHLKVKVEEIRPYLIDVGLSYSTDEQFTGTLKFSNINAFGWAKTNSLVLTAGKDLSRAGIAWYDPRFVGSAFEMTTNAWVQHKKRPSFNFIQIGGSIGWFKRYRRLGFLFRYEIDRNYFVSGDSVSADAESLRNNTLSEISMSTSYDSRDNFADPKRGFFTLSSVDIFNEVRGNNADFFKLNWEGENDISFFWNRFTISTSIRFNRILTIGHGVSIPTNELLFLGGDDTIRGFYEDALGPVDAAGKATGARLRWIWNEELRIRIFGRFQLAGFMDMGSLTNSFSAIGWSTNVRRSAGAGIRYITPVGPIRVDYGFKLDRKPGETRGRLHITFGYVF